MEIPKLFILLCCTYRCIASEHSYNIPVEGYETELQDLGEHVEIPETPVKVIKITKTIAVKVPVPYPVKVREKVPYPVHVAKPYPVPVPQIVKVPVYTKSDHQQQSGHDGNSYQVQEGPQDASSGGHSFGSLNEGQSFGEGKSGQNQHGEDGYSYEGSPGSSYDAPASSYYGHSGEPDSHLEGDSLESQNYEQAIKNYFNKHQPNGNTDGSNSYHNYH